MSSEDVPVFHCPRCHQASGRQDRFAVHEGDQVRVIVKCAECRHRWSVIMAAADVRIPADRGEFRK